jgi:hypothetical protein
MSCQPNGDVGSHGSSLEPPCEDDIIPWSDIKEGKARMLISQGRGARITNILDSFIWNPWTKIFL